MRIVRWIAPALFAIVLLTMGCNGGAKQTPAPKTYNIRGKVLEVEKTKQQILLQHEAIPGFMEAMTMPYRVADPAATNELHVGDQISATLVLTNSGAELRDVVITGQGAPNTLPKVQYHVPREGDA